MNNETAVKEVTNNTIEIAGTVVSEPVFSHETYGEKFYTFTLRSKRISENYDELLICVSERLINPEDISVGADVKVSGQIRTYNKSENNKSHLVIQVFARELIFEAIKDSENYNRVTLTGYICKAPNYRATPLGRKICDLLIAVNRPYGKSDYIPAVAWGRNAGWAGELPIGTKLTVEGRLQSRTYQKRVDDSTSVTKTAYELSINKLELE